MTEENLLQAALLDPTDDTLRLAYSDWLEEQGDEVSLAKATFLRLTARLRSLPEEAAPEVRKRLQELAARLDPEWLVVVSSLDVENCGKHHQYVNRTIFRYLPAQCDRRWDRMQPTGDVNVRFCTWCREKVYYCDTIKSAREHAEAGHCIAVDLGIIRRKYDVHPHLPVPGFPSLDYLRQEEERLRLDPVSAERERRKQAKQDRSD